VTIPPDERRPRWIRRVLHATALSEASRPAFDEALVLARQHRAELVLLFVIEGQPPTVGRGGTSARRVTLRRAATEALESLAASVKARGLRARAIVVTGHAADEILDVAERERVDLIVLGTHGRTGLSRIVLGSVVRRVLQGARCPVLTVRAGRRAPRRATLGVKGSPRATARDGGRPEGAAVAGRRVMRCRSS
jgi:universal stress protein A